MEHCSFKIPKEITELKSLSIALHERSNKLMDQYEKKLNEFIERVGREMDDMQLNRTQCLGYLSIGTLESLKKWEKKYSSYGYLRFIDNKLMRSELLRFIDDKQSGKLYRDMRD